MVYESRALCSSRPFYRLTKETLLWLLIIQTKPTDEGTLSSDKGTDKGMLFWDFSWKTKYCSRRIGDVRLLYWSFWVDPWSLDVHTWQLGQYSCHCTESCLSVMVRWVASSGHVAEYRVFSVTELSRASIVCVSLCVLCFVNNYAHISPVSRNELWTSFKWLICVNLYRLYCI